MVWLPDGEKIWKIYVFVLTEYTKVTDTQTHRQTHTHIAREKLTSDCLRNGKKCPKMPYCAMVKKWKTDPECRRINTDSYHF